MTLPQTLHLLPVPPECSPLSLSGPGLLQSSEVLCWVKEAKEELSYQPLLRSRIRADVSWPPEGLLPLSFLRLQHEGQVQRSPSPHSRLS